jgi:hypothetical protein
VHCSPAFRSSAQSERPPSSHAGHRLGVETAGLVSCNGGSAPGVARRIDSAVRQGTIRRALEKAGCRGRSAPGESHQAGSRTGPHVPGLGADEASLSRSSSTAMNASRAHGFHSIS